MAIDCGNFILAAPPGTSPGWALKVLKKTKDSGCDVILPFTEKHLGQKNKPLVSFVRHPCTWLACVGDMVCSRDFPFVGLPFCMGDLKHTHLDSFLLCMAEEHKGVVTEFFDGYKAEIVIRYEDMPEAFFSFLESVSFPIEEAVPNRGTLPYHSSIWNTKRHLHNWIVENERDFCDRYDYFPKGES